MAQKQLFFPKNRKKDPLGLKNGLEFFPSPYPSSPTDVRVEICLNISTV